jgi:hypothetical protein
MTPTILSIPIQSKETLLFKGLPSDELRALAEVIRGIKAGPGDRLFDEGMRTTSSSW